MNVIKSQGHYLSVLKSAFNSKLFRKMSIPFKIAFGKRKHEVWDENNDNTRKNRTVSYVDNYLRITTLSSLKLADADYLYCMEYVNSFRNPFSNFRGVALASKYRQADNRQMDRVILSNGAIRTHHTRRGMRKLYTLWICPRVALVVTRKVPTRVRSTYVIPLHTSDEVQTSRTKPLC